LQIAVFAFTLIIAKDLNDREIKKRTVRKSFIILGLIIIL